MPDQDWTGFYRQADLQKWLAAIPRRYSCRRFLSETGVPLLSALEYTAARLPLRGVRVAIERCGEDDRLLLPIPFLATFRGVSQYAAIICDKQMPYANLYAGISGEAFILEATSLGVATCWVSGTFRRGACKVGLRDNERIAAIIPFGMAAEETQISHKRKALKKLCADDPATWPLWAYRTAEAVRVAPSAINRQPWRFSYSGSTLRIGLKRLDSLNAGIAVLHAQCALNDMAHQWRIDDKQNNLSIFTGEK